MAPIRPDCDQIVIIHNIVANQIGWTVEARTPCIDERDEVIDADGATAVLGSAIWQHVLPES
jgi:hypothetical protein